MAEKDFRTKNISRHTIISFIYKGGSVLINFLIVPLTISYLNIENYGIWLTLTSFISWFSFFDIGLGNGLRNKFTEAKAQGNYEDAQVLVSTAYYTIGCISLVLIISFLFINQFINWAEVFNTNSQMEMELNLLLPIVFSFFGIQLVMKLITTIYQADQHHSIEGKVQFYIQGLSLLLIWGLTKTDKSSLLLFGCVYSAVPILVLSSLNFFAFKKKYSIFKPKLNLFKKKYLKDIMSIGFKFFFIQISALVLFSTDNFIITRLFSPKEVVPYDISYKYFSIVTMIYTIIITPYWSSFTEAYAKRDFEWIKKAVIKIQKLWFFVPIILLFMVLLADWFYSIWVGSKIVVPIHLSIVMAIFVLMLTFNMIYVFFINGVGKIKLQLFTSFISMIINIPLSVFFAKYFNWGTTGVILATCFCLSFSLLFPIQYFKIINNKAKGIWNK